MGSLGFKGFGFKGLGFRVEGFGETMASDPALCMYLLGLGFRLLCAQLHEHEAQNPELPKPLAFRTHKLRT